MGTFKTRKKEVESAKFFLRYYNGEPYKGEYYKKIMKIVLIPEDDFELIELFSVLSNYGYLKEESSSFSLGKLGIIELKRFIESKKTKEEREIEKQDRRQKITLMVACFGLLITFISTVLNFIFKNK